jgi:hypothetical protein
VKWVAVRAEKKAVKMVDRMAETMVEWRVDE